MGLMDADGPDYEIPGFWFIQTQREDFDCDGTYPLEPVVVLAEHLDDAMTKADDLIVVPEDCTVTGRFIERRATMTEITDWLTAHDAAVEAAVHAEVQPREVRTVEWEYGALAPDGIDMDVMGVSDRFPLLDPPEQIYRRVPAGPWLPVTPSTPNQQGAENA